MGHSSVVGKVDKGSWSGVGNIAGHWEKTEVLLLFLLQLCAFNQVGI